MTWRTVEHHHKHLRLSYLLHTMPFRQCQIVGGCSYCDNPRDKSDRRKVFTVALQHRTDFEKSIWRIVPHTEALSCTWPSPATVRVTGLHPLDTRHIHCHHTHPYSAVLAQ